MTEQELTRQEIQTIALEVLHTVAAICEQQQLRYSLMFGTLIGAVRHQGFIPWDDDIDIIMPRPDYEKLLDYMLEHSGDYPNLKVFNMKTCPAYPYMITRISDDRYDLKMENEDPYGMGVFIDIYPFDGMGNTREEALKNARKGDYLSSLCYQASRKHFASELTRPAWKVILKFPAFLLAKIIGKNYFMNKLENLNQLYEYDSSKYVGCVQWLSNGEKEVFLREWLEKTIQRPFEQYQFRIPEKYDEILSHEYGDYMTPPPEKERIGHHYYHVYRKQ